ncbi:hypothetical protein MBLNU457_7381t2 [Dothideomycetes sp. NU457]
MSRPPGASDSDYDQTLTKHVQHIRKNGAKELPVDPAQDTIAYLFSLLPHSNRDQVADEILIALAGFLTSYDPVQARYAGREWRMCIFWTAQIIQRTGDAQLLQAMRTAILRMDPTGATYTSNHLIFVQLCLSLGLPRQALPLIDNDIYCLPADPTKGIDDDRLLCADHELSCGYITTTSGITDKIFVTEIQEYYLLGAFVYIGVRNYERARLFLEMVLSVPTTNSAVNPYMVEAYKRLQILGLLAQGSPFPSSHLMDQSSAKTIQSLSKPYDALVEAFKNRDLQKFHAELDVADKTWEKDGNLGIVTEAAEALRRFRVIDLASTYAALPVDRVATHLSLSSDATLQLLNNMIALGHVQASISTSDGGASILRFQTQQKHGAEGATEEAVAAQVRKIEALSAFVKEADRRLALTKEYVDYVRRNKKTDGGAASFEDPMEMSWDAPPGGDVDEDIMAG